MTIMNFNAKSFTDVESIHAKLVLVVCIMLMNVTTNVAPLELKKNN